jgi:hypothetical protein
MTKAIALAAVALALSACGDPDLKGEQEAWKRLVDHVIASNKAETACLTAGGLDALIEKKQALDAKRKEAGEAASRAAKASGETGMAYVRAGSRSPDTATLLASWRKAEAEYYRVSGERDSAADAYAGASKEVTAR